MFVCYATFRCDTCKWLGSRSLAPARLDPECLHAELPEERKGTTAENEKKIKSFINTLNAKI